MRADDAPTLPEQSAMRILMVTPEVAPFVKEGGLADVVGALPKELEKQGHQVRIICPKYGSLEPGADWDRVPGIFYIHLGFGTLYAGLWKTHLPGSGVEVYFVEYDEFFGREEVYHGPWGPHSDNDRRFTFLSRAAVELCHRLRWYPDVIHSHDWPTGLLPVYLNTTEVSGELSGTASVLTIHNLEHQGIFAPSLISDAGLPSWTFRTDGLESVGMVNFLKGAVFHATKVTTVSPTYAEEILTPEGGCGLHHALRFRSPDLIGVLNGIDMVEWNPADDPHIEAPYTADAIDGKALNKRALQEHFGLDRSETIPVFAVVSRFYAQKGLDLLLSVLKETVRRMEVEFVILGTGEDWIEEGFRSVASRCGGRVAVHTSFSNVLAHRLYAGADFFVMPSRFEPCGLGQLYAMRYGTIPVVRRTGGLVDTVSPYVQKTGEGTGFVFRDPVPRALADTIGWACSTWYDRPGHIRSLRQRGMRTDFSWTASAARYAQVYSWARDARAGVHA